MSFGQRIETLDQLKALPFGTLLACERGIFRWEGYLPETGGPLQDGEHPAALLVGEAIPFTVIHSPRPSIYREVMPNATS